MNNVNDCPICHEPTCSCSNDDLLKYYEQMEKEAADLLKLKDKEILDEHY